MSFIGSWDTIGQLVAAPLVIPMLAFPILIVVIVVATIWTRQ